MSSLTTSDNHHQSTYHPTETEQSCEVPQSRPPQHHKSSIDITSDSGSFAVTANRGDVAEVIDLGNGTILMSPQSAVVPSTSSFSNHADACTKHPMADLADDDDDVPPLGLIAVAAEAREQVGMEAAGHHSTDLTMHDEDVFSDTGVDDPPLEFWLHQHSTWDNESSGQWSSTGHSRAPSRGCPHPSHQGHNHASMPLPLFVTWSDGPTEGQSSPICTQCHSSNGSRAATLHTLSYIPSAQELIADVLESSPGSAARHPK